MLGYSLPSDIPALAGPPDDDEVCFGPFPTSEVARATDPATQGEPVDGIAPVEAGFGPEPGVFGALLGRMYFPL